MSVFEKSGGCQCGQVQYTLKKRPTVIYLCHCTECQKQSSSAFGISVRVQSAHLDVKGELKSFSRSSKNGGVVCEFCPHCGTRVFHKRAAYSETLNIKGGTFDDSSWIKPAGHIWTGSKQPWLNLPEHDIAYKSQPDNYDALIKAYGEEE